MAVNFILTVTILRNGKMKNYERIFILRYVGETEFYHVSVCIESCIYSVSTRVLLMCEMKSANVCDFNSKWRIKSTILLPTGLFCQEISVSEL